MKIAITIFLSILFSVQAFSQTQNYADFMPLQIGNKWVYKWHYSGSTGYRAKYVTSEVLSDTVLNGKTYYCVSFLGGGLNQLTDISFIRIDPIDGGLYAYNTTNYDCNYESLIVDFSGNITGCASTNLQLVSSYDTLVNGLKSHYNNFRYSYEAHGRYYETQRSFLKHLGPAGDRNIYSGPAGKSYSSIMIGCVLNGVVYGDTSYIRANELFPLKTGNYWNYHVTTETPNGIIETRLKSEITMESFFNGKKYFYITNFEAQEGQNVWVTYDAATNYLYKLDKSEVCIPGNNLYCLDYEFSTDENECSMRNFISNTSEQNTSFGFNSIKVRYRTLNYPIKRSSYLKAGVGITSFKNDPEGPDNNYEAELYSCYINGQYLRNDILDGMVQDLSPVKGSHIGELVNYPNPFNPSTKISFNLNAGSNTRLVIYDMIGREVAVLVDRNLNPGSYEFSFDGSNLSSGVYFYKLTANEFTSIKRMLLVK